MIFAYYGNFTTSYNTEKYIADALEQAGHIVHRIDRNNTNLIKCDYVLFAKLFSNELILKARKAGIPSVCWVFDLYRGHYGYNFPYLKADIVITTDGDDKFHTIRQAVHKPEKIMIKGKKIYDVIFVGSLHYQGRRDMIERIKPKVFGNKRGLALNKLLGQTKIVLGDSLPSTNVWSNRIYEITGRGGFLIHPKTEGLYDYIPQFKRGEEQEMINYYLKNEVEREELRKIQFEKCPTYDDRIKELELILNKVK